MEGFRPEKNKKPWAEGLKAASLAAGFSALPMVDNPAEAQVRPTENSQEHRAERVRESGGVVQEARLYNHISEYSREKINGIQFSIVLDDEGVIEAGIDFPEGSDLPFQQGDRLVIKYHVLEGYYRNIVIDEIRTEDGKVLAADNFVYG